MPNQYSVNGAAKIVPLKKVLIAMPPSMIEALDAIAAYEMRTRSEVFRDILRKYIYAFREEHKRTPDAVMAEPPLQTPPMAGELDGKFFDDAVSIARSGSSLDERQAQRVKSLLS